MASIQKLWMLNTVKQTQAYPFSEMITHEAWAILQEDLASLEKNVKKQVLVFFQLLVLFCMGA